LFCGIFKRDRHPSYSGKARYRINMIDFSSVGGFKEVAGSRFPVGTAGCDFWGWRRIAGVGAGLPLRLSGWALFRKAWGSRVRRESGRRELLPER
jgi:hypothetical protein